MFLCVVYNGVWWCVFDSESTLDDAVTSRDLALFERPPSPGIHTLLYADAKRHDHHMVACVNSHDAASTPTMHSVTPPSWMLSPLPHLATYPRHQPAAHFDPVINSYPVPYPMDHLSVQYTRAHYGTDSVTGYANGISDQCYFAPYHSSVCGPLDYGISVLEPPVKKMCSGSVVVDSSPLHAMAPAEFVSPPANCSIIYAPPPFSADSSMYSCRQMNVSPCVSGNRSCREPLSADTLLTGDATSSAAVVSSKMLAQWICRHSCRASLTVIVKYIESWLLQYIWFRLFVTLWRVVKCNVDAVFCVFCTVIMEMNCVASYVDEFMFGNKFLPWLTLDLCKRLILIHRATMQSVIRNISKLVTGTNFLLLFLSLT